MKEHKINYISFLQIYAILLVCAGHSFTAVESVYGHEWIYNFHMPLFIFISGFLLIASADKKGIGISQFPFTGPDSFIRKKSIRLLLPYFIVSSLTFWPKSLLSQYAMRPTDLSFSSYIHMLLWPQDNVIRFFWFLPTLFIISLIIVAIAKTGILHKYQFFFLFLFLILHMLNPLPENSFLAFHKVVNYLFFYMAGIVFYKYRESISKHLRLPEISILCLLLIIYSVGNFLRIPHPYTVFLTLIGILFSLSLSFIYVRYHQPWFDRYYGSSYTIYLLSWYPCVAVQFLAPHIHLPWYIGAIISTLLQFILPYLVYRLLIHLKTKSACGRWIAIIFGA